MTPGCSTADCSDDSDENCILEVGRGEREGWFSSAVFWASDNAYSGTDMLNVDEPPLTGSRTGKCPHLLRS